MLPTAYYDPGVRVEFPCDLRPDDLAQPALVRRMDVLVSAGHDLKCIALPFLTDLAKTLLYRCKLVFGKDTGSDIGSGKGDRAGDVLSVEGTVEVDGFIIGHHQWVEFAYRMNS